MKIAPTERMIEGSGTAEALWRPWLESARLPCQPLAQWLPATARLVIVAPHPDDEVLGCGGLLAGHAARGGDALLIHVTNGEASHPSTSQRDSAQLAFRRCQESLDGYALLGLPQPDVIHLGLPDGRVAQHEHGLSRLLTVLLYAQDVVVTTWREDGHPDHDATGRSVARACSAAGVRLLEAPVWMWHWATPGDPRVPWQRMQGMTIDAATALKKEQALSAHVSQLEVADGQEIPILGEAIRARAARDVEYFFV